MFEIKRRSIKEQLTEFLLSKEEKATYATQKVTQVVTIYNAVNLVRRNLGIKTFTCKVEAVDAKNFVLTKKQKNAR